jgi:hypothetical protein
LIGKDALIIQGAISHPNFVEATGKIVGGVEETKAQVEIETML